MLLNDTVETNTSSNESLDYEGGGELDGGQNDGEDLDYCLGGNYSLNETLNSSESNFIQANFTEIRLNESENLTEVNISYPIVPGEYGVNVIELTSPIKINAPVNKTKIFIFNKTVSGFNISLPDEARNISIVGFLDNKELKIGLDGRKRVDSPNLITGGVVLNVEGFGVKLLEFLKDLFRFTGFVVKEPSKDIIIYEPVDKLEVQYYLPGPTAVEEQIDEYTKRITIENEMNYSNIGVYSYLDDFGGVVVRDSNGVLVEVNRSDFDEDGKVDYVEWVSKNGNESYDINIVILNFQSFPVVGRNWTVMFNTTGMADLKITPINGTTWGTSPTENDLMFLDVQCGDNVMDSHWENGSVVVNNYSCYVTGYENSRVRTSGGHYLEFDFGGQKAYARNAAACGDVLYSDTTLTGDLINCSADGLIVGWNAGDLTIDCAGYMIDGTYVSGEYGIFLQNGHNVTIKNCNIQQFDRGMLSWGNAHDYTIINNTIHDHNYQGIELYDSDSVGQENHTIVNNTIYGVTHGIYLYKADNNTIVNNTIHTITYNGVYVYYSNNNSLYRNKIYGSSDYGIRLSNADYNIIDSNEVYSNENHNIYIQTNSDWNTVKNNILHDSTIDSGLFLGGTSTHNYILNNTLYGNYDDGISVGRWSSFTGPYNIIENNTVYDNNYGIFVVAENATIEGNEVYGDNSNEVYVYKGSYLVNVSNNIVHHGVGNGIYLYGAKNITVKGNNVYNNTGQGLTFYQSNYSVVYGNEIKYNRLGTTYGGSVELRDSHYNTFENTRFIGGGDFGVRIYADFSDNVFRNVTFANSTDNLVYLGDSTPANNNRFEDCVFERSASGVGLYLGNATNTTIINSRFSGPGANIETSTNYGNNTLIINSTWDQINLLGSHFIRRKWFLDVHVNTTDGDLQDANVSVFDNTDTLQFSELTNASGWIIRKNLTEFIYDGAYTYYNNYTINTTSPVSSYSNDSREINLSTNIVEHITLGFINNALVMVSARIAPSTAYTSDVLLGYCRAKDPEGDGLAYYYRWYKDGILNQSGYGRQSCPSDQIDNGDGTCSAILRPIANGDLNEFTGEYPSGATHYTLVDEVTPNDDVDYVVSSVGTPSAEIAVKENGVISYHPISLSVSYGTFPYAMASRPSDGNAWTRADIEDLQVGERVDYGSGIETELYDFSASDIPVGAEITQVTAYIRSRIYSKLGIENARLTQVYVKVTYVPPVETNYTPGVEVLVNNLSSSYTTKGENWTFSCIANDGELNASYWINDSVVIQNTLPDKVILSTPANGSGITDRTPTLVWNSANDPDGDSITYHLYVNDSLGGIWLNQESIASTEYTFSNDLDLDRTYYWKVRAYDGTGYGNWSDSYEFTVNSLVAISAIVDSVNFSSLAPRQSDNTSDDIPEPFIIQNDGNSLINVSLNATQLFIQAALGTSAYQFKIDNTSEVTAGSSAFNWEGSITDWTYMPSGAVTAIDSLRYQNSSDSAEVDIYVKVPTDETSGSKTSQVNFEATLVE